MEPLDLLQAFWSAMCEWERKACRIVQAAKPVLPGVTARGRGGAAIIAEYCTTKRRAYSQPFSCGDPTMYDPAHEEVLEIVNESANRMVVHTQQRAGFKERRKYVLLRRNDRWL